MGFKEVDFKRLGSLVALVGRNGSGKTRILNYIEKKFELIVGPLAHLCGNVGSMPRRLEGILLNEKLAPEQLAAIPRLIENKHLRDSVADQLSDEFAQILNLIEKTHPTSTHRTPRGRTGLPPQSLGEQYGKIARSHLKRIDSKMFSSMSDALSKSGTSFEDLIDGVTKSESIDEIRSIYESSLNYLKRLPNQLCHDRIDCLDDPKKFEKRKSYRRYEDLKKLFSQFLKKELTWRICKSESTATEDAVVTKQQATWDLDGREFNFAELSDGEKILLCYALLLFLASESRGAKLSESIIIIDEPELHLHPDAEMDLIESLRKVTEDQGQIWIATHSLSILSTLDIDEVFVVKDQSVISPSRNTQNEAFRELLSIEDKISGLESFCSSIYEWAFVRFVTQCFNAPLVIGDAPPNDPQISAIKDFLFSDNNGLPLNVLDFGAGKGRVLEALKADPNFQKRFKYWCLEPDVNHHSDLRRPEPIGLSKDRGELESNIFDIIIVCNVLHEIPVVELVSNLKWMCQHLSSNGKILIIEPRRLFKGEWIRGAGFLLFSEAEIYKLFETTPPYKDSILNEKIVAVAIDGRRGVNVSKSNLTDALEMLEARTYGELKELKNQEIDSRSNEVGRRAAMSAVLNFNARMALEILNQNVDLDLSPGIN